MKSPKHITALKMRRNLGEILENVHYRDSCYLIERAGRPMAAVVPVAWLLQRKEQRALPPVPRDKRNSRHQ